MRAHVSAQMSPPPHMHAYMRTPPLHPQPKATPPPEATVKRPRANAAAASPTQCRTAAGGCSSISCGGALSFSFPHSGCSRSPLPYSPSTRPSLLSSPTAWLANADGSGLPSTATSHPSLERLSLALLHLHTCSGRCSFLPSRLAAPSPVPPSAISYPSVTPPSSSAFPVAGVKPPTRPYTGPCSARLVLSLCPFFITATFGSIAATTFSVGFIAATTFPVGSIVSLAVSLSSWLDSLLPRPSQLNPPLPPSLLPWARPS